MVLIKMKFLVVIYVSWLFSFCCVEQFDFLSNDSSNSKQSKFSGRSRRDKPHAKHALGGQRISPQDIAELRRSAIYITHRLRPIPESFDARIKWPRCESIKQIRNQGKCGSCWAVASASAMTDRLCIATNGTVKFEFSAEELLTCCELCTKFNEGCEGGSIFQALRYMRDEGLVSGGEYNSSKGCQPYSETAFNYDDFIKIIEPCRETCTNRNYNISYIKDKRYAESVHFAVDYMGDNAAHIQIDIMINGPLLMTLEVYENLHDLYKDGVYKTITFGGEHGPHVVKVLGWSLENGDPYWLAANSWGTEWANMNGFFKILRGSNFCGIDHLAFAAIPRVDLRKSAKTPQNFSRRRFSSQSSSVLLSISPVLGFTILLLFCLSFLAIDN